MVVGLLGNESSDSNRFILVTPKSENDARLRATLDNQNPTGLPVGAVRGGKQSNAYNNRGIRQKVYWNIYSYLKYQFGVKSYKSIKRSECEKVLQIIESYQPPFFLEQEIVAENAQEQFTF